MLTCDQLILWQLVLIADMWSTDSMTTRTHCWYVINWFYDNSYSLLTCDQLTLWQLVLIADMWSTDYMTTRTHCWHVINWFYDNSYSLLICAWRCVLLHWIVLKGKRGFTHYQEIKSKYNTVNYISTYLNVRQIFYWIINEDNDYTAVETHTLLTNQEGPWFG